MGPSSFPSNIETLPVLSRDFTYDGEWELGKVCLCCFTLAPSIQLYSSLLIGAFYFLAAVGNLGRLFDRCTVRAHGRSLGTRIKANMILTSGAGVDRSSTSTVMCTRASGSRIYLVRRSRNASLIVVDTRLVPFIIAAEFQV